MSLRCVVKRSTHSSSLKNFQFLKFRNGQYLLNNSSMAKEKLMKFLLTIDSNDLYL
jgi:hypothetical protein